MSLQLKSIKVPLCYLLQDEVNYDKVNSSISRINELSFVCSLFIRDYNINLNKDNNLTFSEININSENSKNNDDECESVCSSDSFEYNYDDNKSFDFYETDSECFQEINYDSDIENNVNLNIFENSNEQIKIELNKYFIKMAFRTISKDIKINKKGEEIKRNGPKPKGDNLELYNLMSDFYDKNFKNKFSNPLKNNKIDATNLSFIIEAISTEMETSYKNNIKMNFFKMIHHFINQIFIKREIKHLSKSEFKKLNANEKIKYNIDVNEENKKIKLIKEELKQVKADIIESTLFCDTKYHDFVEEFKFNLPKLPKEMKSYADYVDLKPLDFVGYLINLNKYLESKKLKLFQPIPLRTSLKNRYVPFDSSVLRDIFNETETNLTNDQLWKKYFNIDEKKYKISGYTFNHKITTDGKTACISFIKNEDVIKKQNKNTNKTNARNKAKNEYKGKTEKEIELIKDEKENEKINNKIKQKEIEKEKRKKNQEIFKKKEKEEQDKIKAEMKQKRTGIMYIEDAVKNPHLLERLKIAYTEDRLIFNDPGKRAIASILGKGQQTENKKGHEEKYKDYDIDNDVIIRANTGNILYSYNTKRRLKDTKRLKHNKIIETIKENIKIGTETIKEKEAKLCKFSCKSSDPVVFGNYVKEKLKLFYDLQEEKSYIQKLNQLDWYSYINTRKHEDTILNEIEEIYGKYAIFIVGDWSKSDKIKYISTPNVKFAKLLSKRFEVYLIDEYNTSKLYHLDEKIESEKLKVKMFYPNDKGKKVIYKKELHSVLTFKLDNKRMNCINRDYNSVLNMKKIVSHLLEYKVRPEAFRRGVKKTKIPEGGYKETKGKKFSG
jgi:hypothetical protein